MQSNNASSIIWQVDRKLTWADFKAKPNNIGDEAAMTASSIEFGYSATNNKYQFKISCKFYPYRSWSIKKKQNDYILQHEQLHFDITELYTRKLVKLLHENIKTKKDVAKLNSIVQNNMKEWNQTQSKYDAETKHSIIEVKQIQWNEYVASELDAYNEYTNYNFTKILK